MKSHTSLADILKLSVSERIQFVEDIWDSISKVENSVALTSSQKEELDVRVKDYQKNPLTGSSWDQVKKRIVKK